MDLGLQRARVLVVAASQGLGLATARQFSREGAIVVISSRSLESLQEAAASIVEETNNAVFTQACDVTKDDDIRRLVRNSAEIMGGIDIIVTNAGGPPAGVFEDFDIEAWRKASDLTLHSHVLMIKEALPYLQVSKRASILSIVSIAAKQPVDNLTLSNTIRPAVVGLTKTLSQEFGQYGIRVNSILPGVTDTGRVKKLMKARAEKNDTSVEDEYAKASNSIPIGRIGQANEFANAAVFLCSPAGGFINGIALQVDGGAVKTTF